MSQGYRGLLVWKKSMEIVTATYKLASCFPKEEMYGLTSQIKRAAVSVPSNIAEGQGRNSTKEFVYHLSVAYGSLMELETQIQIAANLGFVDGKAVEPLFSMTGEVGRMINGLSRSIVPKTANDASSVS
ncbi:MAG: four helix bundle protein [Acidobacteria bacterium]|nr:four helix bundle protein [Acidobacteriota bacterium]